MGSFGKFGKVLGSFKDCDYVSFLCVSFIMRECNFDTLIALLISFSKKKKGVPL